MDAKCKLRERETRTALRLLKFWIGRRMWRIKCIQRGSCNTSKRNRTLKIKHEKDMETE